MKRSVNHCFNWPVIARFAAGVSPQSFGRRLKENVISNVGTVLQSLTFIITAVCVFALVVTVLSSVNN